MMLLFTDLDGTLLDAQSYSPEGSREALRRLQTHRILVIFSSSKTRAEQQPLRMALNLHDPYIVENGSAIVWGDDTAHIFGLSAAQIHTRLHAVQRETGLLLRGYSTMSPVEVADVTGLSLQAAALATRREYSETIVTPFTPQQAAQFQQACAAQGLQASAGGRFYTVTGAGADKGTALHWLKHYYSEQVSEPIQTAAVGDSPNDLPMLQAADRAFLVQRPDGTWSDLPLAQVQRVEGIGPAGFAQAVDRLLAE